MPPTTSPVRRIGGKMLAIAAQSDVEQAAFEELKERLTRAPVLALLRADRPEAIMTDASMHRLRADSHCWEGATVNTAHGRSRPRWTSRPAPDDHGNNDLDG